MPFLPTLRGKTAAPAAIERKSVVPLADYYNALLNAGINVSGRDKPWDLARCVTEGYERSVWAFRAIEAIATAQASLPFRLRDGEETVDDHPSYRVLNQQANPLETARAFRKRLSAQALLSPRGAFVETTTARNGDLLRVDLLPPHRTKPIPGTGADLLSHYEVTDPNGWSTRAIDPEKVRWVREPHPVDPFRAMTPLEAAGLSIELDHYARAYNVNFMANDARPGGVLAVDGEMDESEMNRVESRFGKGPQDAGQLSVIAGQLSYVDLAARPRDLQYGATSKNARTEVLVALGVPESVIGNAEGRTFSNAGEEAYAFWTLTMAGHNSLLVSAFDVDSEDHLEGFLDTSEVEVLQRAAQARREEARTEYDKGLITIDEYREIAGHEIVDNPHTRALYISAGKTPLPTQEDDWTALGLAPPAEGEQAPEGAPQQAVEAQQKPSPPPAVEGGPPQGEGPPEPPPPPEGGETGGSSPPAPSSPSGGSSSGGDRWWEDPAYKAHGADDHKTLTALTGSQDGRDLSWRPSLRVVRERAPAAATGAREDTSGDWHTSDPDEQARERTEMAVAAALEALVTRQAEVVAARISSPKSRKHTRHWTAEYEHDTRVGTKVLDAPRIADPQRWADEAQATVEPLLAEDAEEAAATLLDDLAYAAAAEQAAQQTGQQPSSSSTVAAAAGALAVAGAISAVRRAMSGHTEALAGVIAAAEATGSAVAEIVDEVRDYARRWARSWSAAVASQAATGAAEGARHAAATEMQRLGQDEPTQPQDEPRGRASPEGPTPTPEGPTEPQGDSPRREPEPVPEQPTRPPRERLVNVERQWFSRRDDRVRHTHSTGAGADGQRRGLDEPFVVGASLLRFPGDPLGPPGEVRNCRCFLRYRSRVSGQWVSRPVGERARVAT